MLTVARAAILVAAGVLCAQAWGLQDASGANQGPATVTVTVADRARPAAGVGSRGMDVWRFKAVNRGKQRLRMQYRRPGEKDDDPAAKTVFFQVVVQRER